MHISQENIYALLDALGSDALVGKGVFSLIPKKGSGDIKGLLLRETGTNMKALVRKGNSLYLLFADAGVYQGVEVIDKRNLVISSELKSKDYLGIMMILSKKFTQKKKAG